MWRKDAFTTVHYNGARLSSAFSFVGRCMSRHSQKQSVFVEISSFTYVIGSCVCLVVFFYPN